MPSYTAPVKDMQFLLHDVLKVTETGIPGYADLDAAFTQAVLDEAGKLASDVLAPLNPVGDREGCRAGKRRGAHADRFQRRLQGAEGGRLDRARLRPRLWRAGPALSDGHGGGRDVRQRPTWPSTCIRA